jgi:glycosyltransferase involved in cell wall biosynthesis
MKLSVIIPAYNEEKYLTATLEAVRPALTAHTSAELIVVDNASTDGTRTVAEGFDVRVVTEHEHNISQVRNTGAPQTPPAMCSFLSTPTRSSGSLTASWNVDGTGVLYAKSGRKVNRSQISV